MTVTDRRVCCDFEIDFSNGGGLQGQDFRFDIEGDEIDDAALAARVIADLGLLMVGEVRILNKRIIDEQHKRTRPTTLSPDGQAAPPQFIDLSHVIEDGMITYKGMPAPIVCDHLSRLDSRKVYAEGTEFQIGRLEMVGNTGTYLDTPFHRYPDGYDLADLDLDRISQCPGVVVRVEGMEGTAVDWQAFAATDVEGKAVLVHTGWDRHWRSDQYFENHVFLTEAAALHLRDRGARMVGIDSYNIDDTTGGTRPVHTVLLAAGIPIIEHMTNLAALPIDGFSFTATPPKIRRMGTFPVRAHAIIDA